MQHLNQDTVAESLGRLRAETYSTRPAYHCVPSQRKVQHVIMSALDSAAVKRADPSGQLKPCILLTANVHAKKRSSIGMQFGLAEARRLATDMLALCDAMESDSDSPDPGAEKKAI